MKRRFVFGIFAIAALISARPASGGEWHSAGNAPTPPYHPQMPAEFACRYEARTYVAGKEYRIESTVAFKSEDFKNGGVGFEIRGEQDPGMNGQSFYLSIQPAGAGVEKLVLRATASGLSRGRRFTARSQGSSPRRSGSVETKAELSMNARSSELTSASIDVICGEMR